MSDPKAKSLDELLFASGAEIVAAEEKPAAAPSDSFQRSAPSLAGPVAQRPASAARTGVSPLSLRAAQRSR